MRDDHQYPSWMNWLAAAIAVAITTHIIFNITRSNILWLP